MDSLQNTAPTAGLKVLEAREWYSMSTGKANIA